MRREESNDYSFVINRKHKCVLWRLKIYSENETNNRQKLLGIAFVTHEKVTEAMTELEAPFWQKPFKIFNTVDEAIAWAKSLHAATMQH